MRGLTTSILLITTLATIAPVAAEDCDLKRAHWVCVPNADAGNSFEQFLDRMHRAVDRAFTPPGGWQQNPAVPPESVPPKRLRQGQRALCRSSNGRTPSLPRRKSFARLIQMTRYAISKIAHRAERRRRDEVAGSGPCRRERSGAIMKSRGREDTDSTDDGPCHQIRAARTGAEVAETCSSGGRA